MIRNPFEITKAVDYTDDDLNRYWVDYTGEKNGFDYLMEPDSPMPKIIVGSKGSGKTHIMKHYSYELQKIRWKSDKTLFSKERYIGVYVRCSGFNAEMFSGKGVEDAIWTELYAYYWELWIGELITHIIVDLKQCNVLENLEEERIVKKVVGLFHDPQEGVDSLCKLKDLFEGLQKEVEFEIQNFLFQGKKCPDVRIQFKKAAVSYGYPNILYEIIPFFSNKKILYLIDELENFSESQQCLIQTLLRENPTTCTYRIGTRPYGIRTYSIMNGLEENHDGSEFFKFNLDDFLRQMGSKYEDYILKICQKRLEYSELSLPPGFQLQTSIDDFPNEEIISKVYKKESSQSESYLYRLKVNLRKLETSDAIETIISNLSFPEDRIIERTNIFLFYQKIKNKSTNLLNDSIVIKESAKKFFCNNSDKKSIHYIYLDKHRDDVIDAIAREGKVGISYYGLDKLIALSCYNPRTLLRLLKSSFNAQYYMDGEPPFEKGRISIQAQKFGIEETAGWFFEENRIPHYSQNKIIDVIKRLGGYLQTLRFSDLPPQCSINIFTLVKENMSPESRKVFEDLEQYSYIIKYNERREKNKKTNVPTYALNTILLPTYSLALAKRGHVNILPEEGNIIFNVDNNDDYKKFLSQKEKKFNFPFGTKDGRKGTDDISLMLDL